MIFKLFCIGVIGTVCVTSAFGSGGFKGGWKTAATVVVAFMIGLVIVSDMLAKDAKHRHDREQQIARAWR